MSAWSDAVAALSPYFWHRLGEASGTTMTDSSGNGRNGSYSGSGNTLGVTGLVPGGDGTALTVTTSSFPTTASGLSLSSTNITEALTIKASGARGDLMIATTGTFRLETAGTNVAIRIDTSNSVTTSYASTNLYDGNAHLIVVKITSTDAEVWVDGTLVGSGSHSASTATITQMRLKSSLANPPGTFDEWAVFNGALTTTQIGDLYTAWSGSVPSASVSLAATLRAKTASFSATVINNATLSATMQARTAAFTLGTVAAVSLAGTLPAKTAAFAITTPAVDVTMASTLQPKTAAFEVLADATATLDATLRAKTAAFSLSGNAHAALDATLQPKAAQVVLSTADRAAVLAGQLRRKDADFEVDARPSVGLHATLQPKSATVIARAVTPITPVPVHLRTHGPASVVVGRALGPVTVMAGPHGTQPVYSVSSAAIQRARQQIVVDGVDITFLRGVRTPDVTYTLLAPLRYGPGQLDLPQVVPYAEPLGDDRADDLAWMWEGAPVEVHLVIDDPAGIDPPQMMVRDVYKGVLVAWDLAGSDLSIELGGEASGRAQLRDRQAVIFPRVNDIGHQISDAVKDLGLPVYPPLGTVTGIEVMTTGGVGHAQHIQNLCAQAWTRQGKYWTVMPNDDGAYVVRKKSDTVRHATVFFDDARTVANLRRDLAEEPNRIFITGVTPQGQRVRFGVYPGLIQGPVPDFPGHLEEGDTGEGVRLLVRKLHQSGYLKLVEVAGDYDADVVEAVKDLQDDAGLPKTGEVNLATWEVLYDLAVTGLTLTGAHIEPAAQDPRVRRVNRSANGTVLEFNDTFDASVLPVDRTIDAGVGKTRSQLREFARTVLEAASAPNWFGDITFHTGALLRGEHLADVTATPEIVMDARELIPTMNLWAPRFDGGTQFNIAALQVDEAGTATATVDTRFRDALEVWEIIDRNRESRNDPARRRNMAARSSTIRKDSIGEWDEIGGLLGVDLDLQRGWNVFPVVAATEGTIRKIRIALNTPAEFAYAVFGRKIGKDWLNTLIPHPLTVSGTKAWETKHDELDDDGWILFSLGTHDEPGGYWPGRKTYKSVTGREPNPDYDPDADENETGTDDDEYLSVTTSEASGTLTGKHVDAAGFPYYSADRTTLWVAVWVGKPNKIEAGRIMWPQLEAGA
jgi:peptidoglycan hydrolase-like protein with peptidoglycan-binding domain